MKLAEKYTPSRKFSWNKKLILAFTCGSHGAPLCVGTEDGNGRIHFKYSLLPSDLAFLCRNKVSLILKKNPSHKTEHRLGRKWPRSRRAEHRLSRRPCHCSLPRCTAPRPCLPRCDSLKLSVTLGATDGPKFAFSAPRTERW